MSNILSPHSVLPPAASAVNRNFWFGRRVFITGHTGFKGSWLMLWLSRMGAILHGFALPPPTRPSLFKEAKISSLSSQTVADIRDFAALKLALHSFRPEVIFHLAAQPLVRRSYEFPVETYSVNVVGTLNLLEAIRSLDSVRAIVNVTTDKVYEPSELSIPHCENDRLGGLDPYSSSKACSEILTASYRRSFLSAAGIGLATARAGNVIGGGDWAEDRLIPDVLKAISKGQPILLRDPDGVRPWQHVLEPLSGYLCLAEKLVTHGESYADSWNFGPDEKDAISVKDLLSRLTQLWGSTSSWEVGRSDLKKESSHLRLDISKSTSILGWKPRWNLTRTLDRVLQWYKNWSAGDDALTLCIRDLDIYESEA